MRRACAASAAVLFASASGAGAQSQSAIQSLINNQVPISWQNGLSGSAFQNILTNINTAIFQGTTINGVTCISGAACTLIVGSSTLVGGSTPITSITNGNVLYNNNGTLGGLSPVTTINTTGCTIGGSCAITATANSMTVGTTSVLSGVNTCIMSDNAGTLACGLTLVSSLTFTNSITYTNSIIQNQTISGSAGSNPYNANALTISADTVTSTSLFTTAWVFAHYVNNGFSGGRETVSAYLYINHAPAVSNNNNYAALNGIATATANLGGGAGTEQGALFGLGAVAVLNNGATHVNNMTGAEFNTAAQTGSSVKLKSIIQGSGRGDDAVQGSSVNAMIWMYDQANAAPFSDVLLVDDNAGISYFPVSSTGDIIRLNPSSAVTLGTGIDFSNSNLTFTNYAFRSKNFSVDGSGNATASTMNATTIYKINGTGGATCSGSPTALFATTGGIVTHC